MKTMNKCSISHLQNNFGEIFQIWYFKYYKTKKLNIPVICLLQSFSSIRSFLVRSKHKLTKHDSNFIRATTSTRALNYVVWSSRCVVRVRGVEREGLKGGCCCFHEYTSYIGGERVHWPIAYKVTLLRQDRIPPLTGPTAAASALPDLIRWIHRSIFMISGMFA